MGTELDSAVPRVIESAALASDRWPGLEGEQSYPPLPLPGVLTRDASRRRINARLRSTDFGKSEATNQEETSLCKRLSDPQTDVVPGSTRDRNARSKNQCSMCPAIHTKSRSWLRSSSTREPSDPLLRVVFWFKSDRDLSLS